MDMREDPVLQEEGGLTVTDLSGGLFSSIPEKRIIVVAAYLQLVIDLTSNNKELRVLDILVNAKTIFNNDYIKSIDIYWKEHLAGTLREPFDGGFEANLFNALKHIPKREASEEAANFYKNIGELKTFLNDLAHMRHEKVLAYIKSKYPDSTEITEDVFNRICKDMVDILFQWFSQHCYKGAN